MRNIILITILIAGLMTSYSYAQMGHGMMRDSNMMGQGGHMTGEQGMMGSGQMMEHGKMMGNIRGMTQQISNMMGQLAGTISQDISVEKTHMTSGVMRDVAAEMNRMSFIMDRGTVTVDEMKDLEKRMAGIKKRMAEIIK